MPVMDGIDATRHIRAFEREQSLPPVKIYAVTGIASESMQKDALLAGVDEYLVKPLSLQKLSTIIKPHL
jgi:CheY-like chemotaxis protein